MIIRKLYKIESAHTVRKAVSERCSHNYHGHSGVIEVFLKTDHLDNAGMVYDFGAFKETISSFIDMFDHSVHLWDKDDEESIEFFKKHNERYIILPCNPTAENYSLLFKDCINEILFYVKEMQKFTNGEGCVRCVGVRYHETTTGYAESDVEDGTHFHLRNIEFSPKTLEEASDEMRECIKYAKEHL